MSTRKEQLKDEETTATITKTTSPSQVQQEQQQFINKALDETKNNIRRTANEASSQIPRYTQIVKDYQEQTIQSAKEIADNYLDSQKEIINSFHSAWAPHIQKTSDTLYQYCISPRKVSENYTRVVSSIADNTIAATRLVNNTIFSNLGAFKTSIQNTKDNLKEFSRMGVNAARTFEQTSRDTTTTTRATTFPS